MATVEQAENIEQQVMVNTGRGSVSASVRLAERGVDGLMQAVNALRDALDQRQDERKTARANEPGQVSMSEFKETMRGDREIVALEDTRVADILTTELKRLDVRFAVDSPEPGVQEFHVQGRDAKVLVHALNRAQSAVYDREDDALTKAQIKEKIVEKVEERTAGERGDERERTPEREAENRTREDGQPAREEQPQRTPEPVTFPVVEMVEEGETTVQITKDRALAFLDRADPERAYETRHDPRDDGGHITKWIGRDRDVDRVIAQKFPQLMTEEQRTKATTQDAPEKAKTQGAPDKTRGGDAAREASRPAAPQLDEVEDRGSRSR